MNDVDLYEKTCLSKKQFPKWTAIRTFGKSHSYLCPFCLKWHGTSLEVRDYQVRDCNVLYQSKKRHRAMEEYVRWSIAGASLRVVKKNGYYIVMIG